MVKCDVGSLMWQWNHQMWEDKKTTKCDKSIVTCDVNTTQYEDDTIKCEKTNKGTIKYDNRIIKCEKK